MLLLLLLLLFILRLFAVVLCSDAPSIVLKRVCACVCAGARESERSHGGVVAAFHRRLESLGTARRAVGPVSVATSTALRNCRLFISAK